MNSLAAMLLIVLLISLRLKDHREYEDLHNATVIKKLKEGEM